MTVVLCVSGSLASASRAKRRETSATSVFYPVIDPGIRHWYQSTHTHQRFCNLTRIVLVHLRAVDCIDRYSDSELCVQRAHDGALYIVVTVSYDVAADQHDPLPVECRAVTSVEVALYDKDPAPPVER